MAYTDAQKKATAKYKAKSYRKVSLEVKKEEYESWKRFADDNNKAVSALIRMAVAEYIEKN